MTITNNIDYKMQIIILNYGLYFTVFMEKFRKYIGRIGRASYIKKLLLILGLGIIMWIIINCVIRFHMIVCWGHCESNNIINVFIDLISLLQLLFYLISTYYLTKRFQDCGICGIRGIILGILLPLIGIGISSIPEYTYGSQGIKIILFSSIIPYWIALIIMAFIPGDKGDNKYGKVIINNK